MTFIIPICVLGAVPVLGCTVTAFVDAPSAGIIEVLLEDNGVGK